MILHVIPLSTHSVGYTSNMLQDNGHSHGGHGSHGGHSHSHLHSHGAENIFEVGARGPVVQLEKCDNYDMIK